MRRLTTGENYPSVWWMPAAWQKKRITHRIELTAPDEVYAEVGKGLNTAYELDAK